MGDAGMPRFWRDNLGYSRESRCEPMQVKEGNYKVIQPLIALKLSKKGVTEFVNLERKKYGN
jgi:hypothetical protein